MKALQRLSRRDQGALLAGGVALLAYLIWFGLVQPVRDYSQRQASATQGAAETLVRVQSLAAEISRLEAAGEKPSATAGNLPALVDRTLRRNQLTMAGFQPGKRGDVRLRLEGAAFDDLLQWLYAMEFEHQVRVAELSILPAREVGRVSAQVMLREQVGHD